MAEKCKRPGLLGAKCIGRESNPGLAESSEVLDLEWQRPILPLNHQCCQIRPRAVCLYQYVCCARATNWKTIQFTSSPVAIRVTVYVKRSEPRLIVLSTAIHESCRDRPRSWRLEGRSGYAVATLVSAGGRVQVGVACCGGLSCFGVCGQAKGVVGYRTEAYSIFKMDYQKHLTHPRSVQIM